MSKERATLAESALPAVSHFGDADRTNVLEMDVAAGNQERPVVARREPGSLGKVLLISPQPFYQDRGTPIAIKYVLTALTELGYAVDLLTYPVGSSPSIEGVRYLRLGNPLGFSSIPVSFSARKVFLDTLLAGRLSTLFRREKYVYIHAVEEAAFLAAAFRRVHKTRIVYDMASSLPEQLADNRLFRFPPIMATCRWLEKWLLQHVDSVVASAGLKEKVRQVWPDADVQEWLFPAERIDVPRTEIRALRTELGIADIDKVVVYTGTFEFYQGIDDIIAAIPAVVAKAPKAVFVLVGAKDDKQIEEFHARIDPRLSEHVRILPRIGKNRVKLFLSMADVLVSPRRVGGNVPLKIFDYLAAAKPIVATDIQAHRAIVDDSLAEIVPPGAVGMATGIIRLLSDSKRTHELAEAAATYADQALSWEAFSRFVQSLADNETADRKKAVV